MKSWGPAACPESALTCNVLKRKRGIARDIIDEARFGYDAVALARSGLGKIDESMLGSVAAKVFINVSDATVCLLGGKPEAGRIFVGLDNSLGSLRAVNFACKMLNTSGLARLPRPYRQAPSNQGRKTA